MEWIQSKILVPVPVPVSVPVPVQVPALVPTGGKDSGKLVHGDEKKEGVG